MLQSYKGLINIYPLNFSRFRPSSVWQHRVVWLHCVLTNSWLSCDNHYLQAAFISHKRGGGRFYQRWETEQCHLTAALLANGKILVGLEWQNKIYLYTRKKKSLSCVTYHNENKTWTKRCLTHRQDFWNLSILHQSPVMEELRLTHSSTYQPSQSTLSSPNEKPQTNP